MGKWVVVLQTAEPDSDILAVFGPFYNLREAEEKAKEIHKPDDDEHADVYELENP